MPLLLRFPDQILVSILCSKLNQCSFQHLAIKQSAHQRYRQLQVFMPSTMYVSQPNSQQHLLDSCSLSLHTAQSSHLWPQVNFTSSQYVWKSKPFDFVGNSLYTCLKSSSQFTGRQTDRQEVPSHMAVGCIGLTGPCGSGLYWANRAVWQWAVLG